MESWTVGRARHGRNAEWTAEWPDSIKRGTNPAAGVMDDGSTHSEWRRDDRV